jgi:hypothetical protein
VVRVSGYRSRGPCSIPSTTSFLRTSGSGTGSTQPQVMGLEQGPLGLMSTIEELLGRKSDHLCGLVVRVPGYRSRGPGSIPGLSHCLRSGSGTVSTQPCECN